MFQQLELDYYAMGCDAGAVAQAVLESCWQPCFLSTEILCCTVFQQLELDYAMGPPHHPYSRSDLSVTPIIRMFGITEDGAHVSWISCFLISFRSWPGAQRNVHNLASYCSCVLLDVSPAPLAHYCGTLNRTGDFSQAS